MNSEVIEKVLLKILLKCLLCKQMYERDGGVMKTSKSTLEYFCQHYFSKCSFDRDIWSNLIYQYHSLKKSWRNNEDLNTVYKRHDGIRTPLNRYICNLKKAVFTVF